MQRSRPDKPAPRITRRAFHSLIGGAAAGLAGGPAPASLRPAVQSLLLDWCDGLVGLQIDAPSNPAEHGAFRCPACNFLHGRCADAVYPLLAAARLTKSARYQQAAIRVMQWSRNVDAPDGSWTNEIDPRSWKGITVFGALALAHAIERHGDLLESSVRDVWSRRLRRAGEFIRNTFEITYGNINYPLTATHALFLLGRMLGEPEWQARSRELARQSLSYFMEPDQLLYGEGHPEDKVSPLGCRPVDLGYNVEESLPALLDYARLAGDDRIRAAVQASMRAHLAFMLPDGGWDNSWGTRGFKWTYWGSRTSDGALSAYLSLSREEPGFHTAAGRHLMLLRRCTAGGLLYGGPHLAARGAQPCVHHTFTHAKVLADVLDTAPTPSPASSTPLPRESADGVRFFPEIATWLAARGPWRVTVTRNDWLYQPGVWHPTGGAISMLYHRDVGPLLAGSLASYRRVEPNNMQPSPDAEDYPLTPRVDRTAGDQTFSTLYDLSANVRAQDQGGVIRFDVDAELCAPSGARGGGRVSMTYRLAADSMEISVSAPQGSRLALPLIALPAETVRRTAAGAITISKAGGTVVVRATAPLQVRDEGQSRIFNLVPGFLAVPLTVEVTGSIAIHIERVSEPRR
jgi:hypothetical protein